ncbi:hypothetical protein DER44DRAFT_770167 [Fusarium oxysporum]|nr:hypothetical protein DER44DRAFT_770167 [Fusarium oxysporum]
MFIYQFFSPLIFPIPNLFVLCLSSVLAVDYMSTKRVHPSSPARATHRSSQLVSYKEKGDSRDPDHGDGTLLSEMTGIGTRKKQEQELRGTGSCFDNIDMEHLRAIAFRL